LTTTTTVPAVAAARACGDAALADDLNADAGIDAANAKNNAKTMRRNRTMVTSELSKT